MPEYQPSISQLVPYQFKKGQSGNPLGKNAGRKPSIVTQLIRIVCEEDSERPGLLKAQRIAATLYQIATDPKDPRCIEAIKVVLDRIDGKPLQRVELLADEKRSNCIACYNFLVAKCLEAGHTVDSDAIVAAMLSQFPDAREMLADVVAEQQAQTAESANDSAGG